MKTNRFRPVLLVATLCALAGSALGQGPTNRTGNNSFNGGDTTSNQRNQTREARIRNTLSAAGYTDPDLQRQVLSLAQQEQAASQSLLPKINALRSALIVPRNNTNNDNFNGQNNALNATAINTNAVANLFADYRSAVSNTQEARADAIGQLDKSISFSTDPVLEALLTMLGVVGDETGFVSNLAGQAQLPGFSTGGSANSGGGNGGFGGTNAGNVGGFGMNGGMMPPPPPNGN